MSAKTLAIFPGQGSQYVGMGKDLLSQFSVAKEVFEEAEDAIGIKLRKLCLDGPESDLALTANTQPTILTVSVATWRILEKETALSADGFAGHSLGEYSALVASDKLSFADAVRIVRKRGEAMQRAVPLGKGAMAAVMKMEAASLEKKCSDLSHADSQVQVVNYNNPQQLVVAGHSEAVDRLVQQVQADGKRAIKLNVSAPFHSKLMAPARKQMESVLREISIQKNAHIIFPNLTAKATSQDYSVDLLLDQIDNPVLWTQTIENAQEQGYLRFVEVGPSSVLSGLLRRTPMRDGSSYFNTDPVQDAIKKLQS